MDATVSCWHPEKMWWVCSLVGQNEQLTEKWEALDGLQAAAHKQVGKLQGYPPDFLTDPDHKNPGTSHDQELHSPTMKANPVQPYNNAC